MTIDTSTKLGRYEIRSQLGAGGMGEVYRARDTELGRDTFGDNASVPITVVLNWTADLKR